jgi:hypothetical protein
MPRRINIYMKHRLFEDSEIPDINRQVAGIGPGSRDPGDPGATRAAEYLQQKNGLQQQYNNKPYPIEHLEQSLADALVNLSNIQKLLDIAKANPVLKGNNNKIENMNEIAQKVARLLVDFNDKLTIIKGNE